MKKWNEDGNKCKSCIGFAICSRWQCDIHGNPPHCFWPDRKYYANKEQCERLLKLWDDAERMIRGLV